MGTRYQVSPVEPPTVEASEVHLPVPKVGFLGPALLVALAIFVAWIPLAGNHIISDPNLEVLPLVELGGLVVSFFIFKVRQERVGSQHACVVAEKASELQAIRRRGSQAEADKLTQSVLSIRSAFEGQTSGLKAHVHRAEECLRQAQQEFEEQAFSPFWDRIEAAAKNLAELNRSIVDLDLKAMSYYQLLSGRNHNFPPLADISRFIPNPEPALKELSRLVRKGQTNHDFAVIWEHRRTRKVLIAGFSSLGEAIERIGPSISYSIEDLGSALSSGLDELTREQRRMIEKLESGARV